MITKAGSNPVSIIGVSVELPVPRYEPKFEKPSTFLKT